MILSPTGQHRDGLPVLAPRAGPQPILDVLCGGFSGRLLRLYSLVQQFLHRDGGPQPEPAYLLLSEQEGGFAKTGFHLGEVDKRHVDYVDLKAGSPLSGVFGAVDQIFPHELGHVILRQLAGDQTPGGCNQVHAISLRTDPVVAFDEGFAEHLQVMAVDDPGAATATRTLASDAAAEQRMDEYLGRYLAEAGSDPWPENGLIRRFLFWFGQVEQAERYFAVKHNRFAWDSPLPERLIHTTDPYRAYLIESVVPGGPGNRRRSPARAFSTEGFVSTFFVRLVASRGIKEPKPEGAFYARFGVDAADVSPIENAYLKILHVLHLARPRTLERFIGAYCEVFHDEAPSVHDLVGVLLLGQEHRPAPSIWLANRSFVTGTSLFDQHRCVPRVHTFDLNAASVVDLVGVPGVDLALATSILARAPISDLSNLRESNGMTAGLLETFVGMKDEMQKVVPQPANVEVDLLRSLPLILKSYGSGTPSTGGRRIPDHDQLRSSLRARGLDPTAFSFCLDVFRYRAPPHGGLAIGAGRLTVAVPGLTNMHEVAFFPRNRLAP